VVKKLNRSIFLFSSLKSVTVNLGFFNLFLDIWIRIPNTDPGSRPNLNADPTGSGSETLPIIYNLVEPVRILDKNSHHRPGSGSGRKLGIRRKVPDAQALDTTRRYLAYNSFFVGLAVASERAAVMLAATKTKHVFSPGD
jgi:hypothetical protein